MDLEIISCKVDPNARHLAEVIVKYGLLHIRCGLTLYIRDKEKPHLWLRMPEYWIKSEKIPEVSWINKPISDAFQAVALGKIAEKYGIDLKKGIEIYKMYCKKRKKSRKS